MHCYHKTSRYTGPLRAVVLDWAGTAVDYGCMGPAAVFVDVFAQFEIEVSVAEARSFMGVAKKEHIRRICALDKVKRQWQARYGKAPDETAIDALYARTEPMMAATAARFSDPIPGLLETVAALRTQGLKIGSSTGYTQTIMAALVPAAAGKGYDPDTVVSSSDVPAGRPYPWMCYLNAIRLEVFPLEAVVKIGDTTSDIEAGRNAGMWTIGLTQSGNELGLTRQAAESADPAELRPRIESISARFQEAGAHFTAAGVWEVLPLIDEINARLSRGERP